MAKIWVEMVVKWPFMSRKFDAPPSKLTLFKPGGQIMPLTLLPTPRIQKAIFTSSVEIESRMAFFKKKVLSDTAFPHKF